MSPVRLPDAGRRRLLGHRLAPGNIPTPLTGRRPTHASAGQLPQALDREFALREAGPRPPRPVRCEVLAFKGEDGRRLKRYQFTAIDGATRVRALRTYERHNQESAIDFLDHEVARFPFRINTVRTDNGHEWQAQFHWHCEDLGMRHVYIKPGRPNLNGKVERSHLADQIEFYQLLDCTGDVDLRAKLAVWEEFRNLQRPHTALDGRTPYEVLREKPLS